MIKEKIGKTALANLKFLSFLGITEASKYLEVVDTDRGLLDILPKKIQLSIAPLTEIMYKSTNERIRRFNNPVVLDLACGYSPRCFIMAPEGYKYIGGDLPGVISEIREQIRGHDDYQEYLECFKAVDVVDYQQMHDAIAGTTGPVTIITQALLSYLSPEQMRALCTNVKKILEERGGIWLIPDGNPDRILGDTVGAVMGDNRIVSCLYYLRNKMIKFNNKDENTRKSLESIATSLVASGFKIKVEPLWIEGLDMKVLDKLDKDQQTKLLACWKNLNSICAYVK